MKQPTNSHTDTCKTTSWEEQCLSFSLLIPTAGLHWQRKTKTWERSLGCDIPARSGLGEMRLQVGETKRRGTNSGLGSCCSRLLLPVAQARSIWLSFPSEPGSVFPLMCHGCYSWPLSRCLLPQLRFSSFLIKLLKHIVESLGSTKFNDSDNRGG